MAASRRPAVLAGILVVLLGVLAWRQLGPGASTSLPGPAPSAAPTARAGAGQPAPGTASPQAQGPAGARPAGRGAALQVPEVGLGKLDTGRAAPEPAARNPFRFQAPAPPPPGARPPAQPSGSAATRDPANPPPVSLPPIPLRLIGIIEGARGGRIAVLTDNANRGDSFYGREGDIIDGRFRIVKIGIESVDLEYVDGRGRQPIRLSGG